VSSYRKNASRNGIQVLCCKANEIIRQLTPIIRNKNVTLDTKRALYYTIFILAMSIMATNIKHKRENRYN
jgi:hypothetical protein